MTKTYDYIIVLKRPNYKVVDLISQLMLLLSVAAFGYESFIIFKLKQQLPGADISYAIYYLIVIACILGWWIFCRNQAARLISPNYRFGLMLCAMGWLMVPSGKLFAFIYLVACLLEKPVKVSPEVGFDEEEILFNSLPSKRYLWNVINNVVLKDGLLTIDLKNNTLIQKPVDARVSPEVEKEFNEFCKQNLR